MAKERESYQLRLEEEIKKQTEVIEEQNKKLEIETISLEDMMSHYYNQKKSKDLLIDHLENGYMTFDKEGVVLEGASKVTENLLMRSLFESESSYKIWDVFFDESKVILKVDRKNLGRKVFIQRPFTIGTNQIVSEKTYVEIEYKPIYWEDEMVAAIMVILKDKTKFISQEKIKRR